MVDVQATVGGDKFPADITAGDVHALFCDFIRGKKRVRPIPTLSQCEKIAVTANEIIKRRNLAPNIESISRYSDLLTAGRRSEDVLKAAKSLRSELKKFILALKSIPFAEGPNTAIAAANEAQADFESKFKNMRQDLELSAPLLPTPERDGAIAAANNLDSANDLLCAVRKYIDENDRDNKESPRHVLAELRILQKVTISALESAGWKNVSSDSDKGPVSFVVAALMTRMTGNGVHPSKIRRLKPRQKKL